MAFEISRRELRSPSRILIPVPKSGVPDIFRKCPRYKMRGPYVLVIGMWVILEDFCWPWSLLSKAEKGLERSGEEQVYNEKIRLREIRTFQPKNRRVNREIIKMTVYWELTRCCLIHYMCSLNNVFLLLLFCKVERPELKLSNLCSTA